MNHLKDLNIEKELLPLFDYSLNKFTRNKILELLKSPLSSIGEIKRRQDILKGFKANDKILKDYSYTVLYFNEIYSFLNNIDLKDFPKNSFKYQFTTSKMEKLQNRKQLSLLILFFHRLYFRYFSRLNLNKFPYEYQNNIKSILKFLSTFKLNQYENIIRENQLKNKNVLEIIKTIEEHKNDGEIKAFWNNLFLFESYLSLNKTISKQKLNFPEFSEDEFEILKFYHPLLSNPIKNTIRTQNNVIVINGPNMSGKSTLLKAIGLCVYLGHLGIGIPAEKGIFPFFKHFFIEINRKDDILKGYSHFMTEIINLKNVILKAKDKENCLAIFDELFSGTNAEDATEISKTTVNGLRKFKKSFFFISTHIQELKSATNNDVSNYYLDCKLSDGKPDFTYQLKKGWSDIKVGRILFKKIGLNDLLNNR